MMRVLKNWWIRLAALPVAGGLVLIAIYWTDGMGSAAPATADDLTELIAARGSVTFRSWGGKWIGTDCDTDITFLPNQVAYMIEYGVGVKSYKATYSVDSTGQVTLRLKDFGHKWPVMILDLDAVSLRLRPTRGGGLVMGNRGGATVIGGQGSYWPFRPISPNEEAVIRERWAK